MTTPSFLAATWENELFSVTGTHVRQELNVPTVRSLATDGLGSAFAIVGRSSVRHRSSHGEWTELVTSDVPLSCCVSLGNAVHVGTDDARVLRVEPDGTVHDLRGFGAVAGRETWYAGTALVDGEVIGPPLGVRSMSATCDGAVLLANVHVGGIPRSTDAGATWQPTLDIDNHVHQVCAHPTKPERGRDLGDRGHQLHRGARFDDRRDRSGRVPPCIARRRRVVVSQRASLPGSERAPAVLRTPSIVLRGRRSFGERSRSRGRAFALRDVRGVR